MENDNNGAQSLSMSWYNFYLFINGAIMLFSLLIMPTISPSDRFDFADIFPILKDLYYFPFVIGLFQLPAVIGLFKKKDYGYKANKVLLAAIAIFYVLNFITAFESYNGGAVPLALAQLVLGLAYVSFTFQYFEKRQGWFTN